MVSTRSRTRQLSTPEQPPRRLAPGDDADPGSGEQLGRGCRVRRPVEFYEGEQPPLLSGGGNSGGKPSSRREAFDEAVRSSARPLRHAALVALRKMHGLGSDSDDSGASSSDSDDDANKIIVRSKRRQAGRDDSVSNASTYEREVRRTSTGGGRRLDPRLKRVLSQNTLGGPSAGSEIALDDARDASSDDAEVTDSDSGADGGVSTFTRHEAEQLAKRRGSINNIVSKSRGAPRGQLVPPNLSSQQHGQGNARSAADALLGAKRGRDGQPLVDLLSGGGDGGAAAAGGDSSGRMPTSAELGDVTALAVDPNVTFASVGGLPGHILALRESIVIPLLYPELMRHLRLRPPRGMLFVGPPGTGKTLVARALANEARADGRGITFFMRKGADVLSKWVGESERQLRLLFDEARRRQPSVIFFDEIDGLAPVRHARQEQSHAALVSTLLALLDGLDDRGDVVVIGATNRVDTVDPALRRPGRFDRELFFPLPDDAARRHILTLHTTTNSHSQGAAGGTHDKERVVKGRALPPAVLTRLVHETRGFSGADLAALVTEARLCALRRLVPQLYTASQRLVVPSSVYQPPGPADFTLAVRKLQPSVQRLASAWQADPAQDRLLQVLLAGQMADAVSAVSRVWPPMFRALRASEDPSDDLGLMASKLSRVPPPAPTSRICLVVEPSTLGTVGYQDAVSLAMAALHAVPSIPIRVCHLPLTLGGGAAGVAAGGQGPLSEFDGLGKGVDAGAHGITSILDLVASIRRSSPCAAVLLGFDAWLQEADPAALASVRYALSTTLDADVLFVVPRGTQHSNTAQTGGISPEHILFEGNAAGASSSSSSFSSVRSDVVVLRTNVTEVRKCDGLAALEMAAQQCLDAYSATGLGAGHPSTWATLPVDRRALKKASRDGTRKAHRTEQQRVAARERWARVQYKRAQLRQVLRGWIMSYIGNGVFRSLCDRDLDLDPEKDAEDLRLWRQHTRGRRVGLLDVLDKLDNLEYTCLSQYNDDIDLLHQNVIGFFSHRDPRGLRYRTRATQLRDATIMNNLKIRPALVSFTEETKDEDEPDDSSASSASASDDDGGSCSPSDTERLLSGGAMTRQERDAAAAAVAEAAALLREQQAAERSERARQRARRRRRFYDSPRRKKKPNKKVVAAPAVAAAAPARAPITTAEPATDLVAVKDEEADGPTAGSEPPSSGGVASKEEPTVGGGAVPADPAGTTPPTSKPSPPCAPPHVLDSSNEEEGALAPSTPPTATALAGTAASSASPSCSSDDDPSDDEDDTDVPQEVASRAKQRPAPSAKAIAEAALLKLLSTIATAAVAADGGVGHPLLSVGPCALHRALGGALRHLACTTSTAFDGDTQWSDSDTADAFLAALNAMLS